MLRTGKLLPSLSLPLMRKAAKLSGAFRCPTKPKYFAIDEERGLLYSSQDGFISNITERLINGSVTVIDQKTFTVARIPSSQPRVTPRTRDTP